MVVKVVTFDYDIGDEVIIPGLNNATGYVLSLWYSDRCCKYEVAFYCGSERIVEYLLPQEIKPAGGKTTGVGYLIGKDSGANA